MPVQVKAAAIACLHEQKSADIQQERELKASSEPPSAKTVVSKWRSVDLSKKRNYLDISRRKSLAETNMQEANY